GQRLPPRRAAVPVAPELGQRLPPRRAAAPVALGRGQRLPPRRAAAPVALGRGQRLPPRRAAAPADVRTLPPPLFAAGQRPRSRHVVALAAGQRLRSRPAVAPADGEFPPAERVAALTPAAHQIGWRHAGKAQQGSAGVQSRWLTAVPTAANRLPPASSRSLADHRARAPSARSRAGPAAVPERAAQWSFASGAVRPDGLRGL